MMEKRERGKERERERREKKSKRDWERESSRMVIGRGPRTGTQRPMRRRRGERYRGPASQVTGASVEPIRAGVFRHFVIASLLLSDCQTVLFTSQQAVSSLFSAQGLSDYPDVGVSSV